MDRQRAELFALGGALAAPLQWFGGPGQQRGPWEVPVELFVDALDVLARDSDRLAIVGVSFGAEAALIVGAIDQRVDRVAAFAPTAFMWGAYDEDRQQPTSKWTYRGTRLPCLPIERPPQPPAAEAGHYVRTYEHSLAVAPDLVRERATIPTERIAELLLVAGGDDQVWPSHSFARTLERRRKQSGMTTTHVTLTAAGHRTLLPGESAPTLGRPMVRGGTPEADKELGRLAWPHLRDLLSLHR